MLADLIYFGIVAAIVVGFILVVAASVKTLRRPQMQKRSKMPRHVNQRAKLIADMV